jgi:hypothetical protein
MASKPQAAAPTKPEPPNFLTLPREVRQSILYMTYDFSVADDYLRVRKRPRVKLPGQKYKPGFEGYLANQLPYVNKWVQVLCKVHPIVCDDLGFVVKEWTEALKVVLEEYTKGRLKRVAHGTL